MCVCVVIRGSTNIFGKSKGAGEKKLALTGGPLIKIWRDSYARRTGLGKDSGVGGEEQVRPEVQAVHRKKQDSHQGEGGEEGGSVICNGKPENLVKCKDSYLAKFLEKELR